MILGVSPSPANRRGRLSDQVRLARVWLPLTIVGVVLVHQLLIVPLGGPDFRFWAQLVFYSLLGPLATFITLNWIAREAGRHERAQEELARLFEELRISHELLGAIQDVTARFAAAPDLETMMDAAAGGLADVTGARAVALVVGPAELGVTQSVALPPELQADALARDRQARERAAADSHATASGETITAAGSYTVLSRPLAWGGAPEGSVHAYFAAPPDERAVEAFSILAVQFSAAAEATRFRTRDLLTLVEVDRSIRAEGNLQRLLSTVLTHMMARVGAPAAGVFLANEEGILRLGASVGVARGAPIPAPRPGGGLIAAAAASRDPLIVGRLDEPQRASAGPLLDAAQSAIALPIWSQERLLGVIVLAHPEPDMFNEVSVPFLWLLANQVTLAVRNASAYLQSEELAIAEERSRIAREIHDGAAQLLAVSALKLDLVAKLRDKEPARAAAELDEVRDGIRETIRELRRSIFALRPVALERHGFVETVRRYVADFGQQNDAKVTLEHGALPELSIEAEAVLFRIFQEAMHNVAKHARASSVTVELGTAEDGMAFVRVSDDGAGFEPEQVSGRVTTAGGLGLMQMRERVVARGGRLELHSRPGEGTALFAAVPG